MLYKPKINIRTQTASADKRMSLSRNEVLRIQAEGSLYSCLNKA
jgi:hypothetical protein